MAFNDRISDLASDLAGRIVLTAYNQVAAGSSTSLAAALSEIAGLFDGDLMTTTAKVVGPDRFTVQFEDGEWWDITVTFEWSKGRTYLVTFGPFDKALAAYPGTGEEAMLAASNACIGWFEQEQAKP